jgi:hypothetical protein
MGKKLKYFLIGFPFGIILSFSVLTTITRFGYAIPYFIELLSYLLYPALLLAPLEKCMFFCGIFWLIIVGIELGIIMGLFFILVAKLVSFSKLKNREFPHSFIIFFLIFLFLITYLAVYPSLGSYGNKKIEACFNNAETGKQRDDCLLSFVYDLTHMNPEFDLPDVEKHCNKVPQKDFDLDIKLDPEFAVWVFYTGFNERDYCYYYFSQFAFYINKYGILNKEEVYQAQIKICNNLIDSNNHLKKDKCLFYVAISPTTHNPVPLCGSIEDVYIKTECINKTYSQAQLLNPRSSAP